MEKLSNKIQCNSSQTLLPINKYRLNYRVNTLSKLFGCSSLLLSFLFSPLLLAEPGDGPESNPTTQGTNYRELFNLDHKITPYTSQLFGEQIGLSTGSLSFRHTDVSIPGNFALPVEVTRVFNGTDSLDSVTRDFGSWGIDLPHIRSNLLAEEGELNYRGIWADGIACSGTLGDVGSYTEYNVMNSNYEGESGQSFWNGDNIHIPGKGTQKMLSTPDNGSYKRTTNNQWKVDCINAPGGYEGFKVTTNDGVKYTFDKLRMYKGKTITLTQLCGFLGCTRDYDKHFDIYHAFMLPSKVEDKFGNSVIYEYGAQTRLESITASDGRKISITYKPLSTGFEHLIDTVTAHSDNISISEGRTWTYDYENKGAYRNFGDIKVLTTVTRPDGKMWGFEHPSTNVWKNAFIGRHVTDPRESCTTDSSANGSYINMTHPEGLVADFNFSEISFRRSNVPNRPVSPQSHPTRPSSDPTTWQYYQNCGYAFAIEDKTITQLDNSKLVWSYNYHGQMGNYEGWPGLTLPYHTSLSLPSLPSGLLLKDLKSTEVTAPDGSKMAHHFSGSWGWTENQELFTDYYDVDGTSLLRRVAKIFQQSETKRGESYVRDDFTSEYFLRTTQVKDKYTYTDSSDEFTTDYSDFNLYDVPRVTIESGGTHGRYIKQSFQHDTDNWVLNLPTRTELGTSAGQLTEAYKKEYTTFPSTGEVLMPSKEYRYGRWGKDTKSYHSYGLPKKVEFNASLTQGSGITGHRYVEFSAYKRGQVTTIALPNRYSVGEMTMSRDVNDYGWVTSSTDLGGHTTGYTYNDMGWLQSIDLPGADYDDTVFVWDNSSSYLKRTEKRCTLNATNTDCQNTPSYIKQYWLDGFLRPFKTKTIDNATSKNRFQHFTYNIYNQQLTASYPNELAWEKTGVTYTYDGLQRLNTTSQYGGGTSTITYKAGNKKSISNFNSNITTTQYQAFGSPTYNTAISIVSPEQVTTTIDVDVFGLTQFIKQHDGINALEQFEYYGYDTFKQLCLVRRQDVGNTAYHHNALGEVQWMAQGVTATSNSCQASPSDKVNYVYDNLGDVHEVNFDNTSTPNQVHVYDNDGLLKELTVGILTEPDNFVSQNYNYNALHLLEDESTSFITGNSTFKELSLDYNYNKLGHLNDLTYPATNNNATGHTITYSPNAFGEPTQAVREGFEYATNATYYANGMLDGFTYGNGLEHKTLLNTRQLPMSIVDKMGDAIAIDQSYTYDAENNLKSLTDGIDDLYSITNITYDGLERVTNVFANSKMGNSSISYDGLGNIKTYSSLNANLKYEYDDAKNRLTKVNQMSGSTITSTMRDFTDGYDSKGNVTNNGERSFTYNAANQMVNSNGNTYVYDGHNRRVKQTDANGTSLSLYSQAGQLIYREANVDESGAGYGINYIYLGNKLIAKDGNGVNVSNDSRTHYKPFGETLETPKDDVGYTGHKFDTDLGLSYMQARYYDPVIGRFYSNDPVGFTGEVDTFNRYSYVANNPYKYIDPDGERKQNRAAGMTHLVATIGEATGLLTPKQAKRMRRMADAMSGKLKAKPPRNPKVTNQRWERNKQQNNGETKCDNCGKPVKRYGQTQSGDKIQPDRGEVDHIIELQDDPTGDNVDNTDLKCNPCHVEKTKREREKRKK